jgi:hypothetical protein
MCDKITSLWSRLGRRAASEAGEGVISAAIAVLIMAFLGVAMWVAFDHTFNRAAARIDEQIGNIGGGGGGAGLGR